MTAEGPPERPAPAERPAPGWIVAAVPAAFVLLVLGVVLWPSGAAIRHVQLTTWLWIWRHAGSPGWFTPEVWSAVANAALFAAPAAVLVGLGRARWWTVSLALVAVSAAVETYQAVGMTGQRQGSVADVLTNGTGAVAGAFLASRLRRSVGHRRADPKARALTDSDAGPKTGPKTDPKGGPRHGWPRRAS